MPSRFHVTGSALVHLVLAAILFWPGGSHPRPLPDRERRERPEIELLVSEPIGETENEPIPEMPSTTERQQHGEASQGAAPPPPPLQYAGQRPAGSAPPAISETERREPAGPSRLAESVTDTEPPHTPESGQDTPERELLTEVEEPSETLPLLAAADTDRPDGLQVPAFSAIGLGTEQMERMLEARQAECLLLADRAYVVHGPLRQPREILPVDSRQLGHLSDRALPVPQARAILNRWSWEFARRPKTTDQVRLVLNKSLDRLIYHRQIEAAQRLGQSLDQLLLTAGQFIFGPQGVTDFRIHEVTLRDGRRLQLAEAS